MIAKDLSRSDRTGRRTWRLILPAALAMGLALPLAGCKSPAEKAAEYYQSGLDLVAAGDLDRAIVQFRNVFDIEGNHYEARKALAEALASKGDASGAYSQYLRLAEQYAGEPIEERVAFFKVAEQELIETPDEAFRFHSGIPRQ